MQMKEINKLTDEFNWKTGLYHGVDYRTSLKIPKGSYRIKDGEPTKSPAVMLKSTLYTRWVRAAAGKTGGVRNRGQSPPLYK
jgi:hypothetical protein